MCVFWGWLSVAAPVPVLVSNCHLKLSFLWTTNFLKIDKCFLSSMYQIFEKLKLPPKINVQLMWVRVLRSILVVLCICHTQKFALQRRYDSYLQVKRSKHILNSKDFKVKFIELAAHLFVFSHPTQYLQTIYTKKTGRLLRKTFAPEVDKSTFGWSIILSSRCFLDKSKWEKCNIV